jgi:hypothetical protein
MRPSATTITSGAKPAGNRPFVAGSKGKQSDTAATGGDSLSLSKTARDGSKAETWSCVADPMSKQYTGPGGARPERSWRDFWRAQVPIQCTYTCTKGDKAVETKATHTVSFWTESDDTLSCQGISYRRQWVNAGPGYAREVSIPEPRRFIPGEAMARDLDRKSQAR